jgi:excisionase family DNA binding protein
MGLPNKIENFVPTPEGQKEARRFLNLILSGKTPISKELKTMIVDALQRYSDGQAVIIGSSEDNYTTQEAADYLQVSRKHLIKMLDEEKIPFFRVGSHRRIKKVDVLAYKKRIDEHRLKCLEKMTAIAEEAENETDGK